MIADFSYDSTNDVLTCTFLCRMDSEAASKIPELLDVKLKEALGDRRSSDTFKVIFDLKKVEYASSLFLRIALMAARRVKQGNFSIIHANKFIKELVAISGFNEWLAS